MTPAERASARESIRRKAAEEKKAHRRRVLRRATPAAIPAPPRVIDKRVYFMQAGHCGLIKIGWSNDPVGRMGELASGSQEELRLLAVLPLGVTERQVHDIFAKHRVRGEWFEPAQEIVDAIDRLFEPCDQFIKDFREVARVSCGDVCAWNSIKWMGDQ